MRAKHFFVLTTTESRLGFGTSSKHLSPLWLSLPSLSKAVVLLSFIALFNVPPIVCGRSVLNGPCSVM